MAELRMRAALIGIVALLFVLLAPASNWASGRVVYRAVVDGPISPAVADFIKSSIEQAHDADAALLIIQLDTPGGLLNSTKTIAKDLLASPVPVAVWVAPGGAGAISAGVFITLAAHVAVMAPGTTIGAAHPVSGQGGDIKGDMREKVENYAVSFVESIANRRGRNVEWAEKAVRESVAITEVEAVELGVVDFAAGDIAELLQKASGMEIELAGKMVTLDLASLADLPGGPAVHEIEMTLRQKVLSIITDPNIAYLLMMAGMLGLYMEFSNPGTIFPGVAGAICLLLALLASQVLPINSTGVLLLVLGMAFLLGELVMPSFGVLGFGGIIALTLGSLFLYTPESNLAVDTGLILGMMLTFTAALLVVVVLLVKDKRRPSTTGAEGLVGEIGVASGDLREVGTVRVHGELWRARCGQELESGTRVRVVSIDGLELTVVVDESGSQ